MSIYVMNFLLIEESSQCREHCSIIEKRDQSFNGLYSFFLFNDYDAYNIAN